MPRKKIAAAPGLEPPKSLAKGAATIWREIVGGLAEDHFGPQDRQHLAAYVHAAWVHDCEIGRDKKRRGSSDPNVVADAASIMARLGPQLRLTVSSRMEPRTAATSGRRARTELSSSPQPSDDWRGELH